MSVVWFVLVFLAGMAFWHWCGSWLWRRFGLAEDTRKKMLQGVSTDALILLQRDSQAELDRRHRAIEEAGQ